MNIEDVRAYSLTLPGATEDMPYGPDMVVFRIEGKIFLHLPLEYDCPRMAVKLPPDYAIELRDKYTDAITPSWHLNKKHWSDILLEGHFDDEQLKKWIDQSYQLVFDKLPKKLREKYTTPQPEEKPLSDYERYCLEQAQAFEEELGDDRCYPDMPEGHFVRSH